VRWSFSLELENMSPLGESGGLVPSPPAVEIVRATLKRLGYAVSEADARSVAEAVLSVEGPRLELQVRGKFENSLEIIRDTAEAALGSVRERRVERSDLLGGGRRPVAARPQVVPLEDEIDDDEPRPVFKRPRR
jgi:hypothetical protein